MQSPSSIGCLPQVHEHCFLTNGGLNLHSMPAIGGGVVGLPEVEMDLGIMQESVDNVFH